MGNKGESGCSPLRKQHQQRVLGFEGQEPEREPGPWHGFDPTAAREEESRKNVLGQSMMFSEVSEALWRALSK